MAKGKEQESRLLRNRFLKGEEQENLYITFALYFIIVFMSFLLIFVCLVGMCKVMGTSMNPSLDDGEYVLMLKNPTSFKSGDVVTFYGEIVENGEKVEKSLIKRVIGVGGDDILFVSRKENGVDYIDIYRNAGGTSEWKRVANDEFGETVEDMRRDRFPMGKYGSQIASNLTEESIAKNKIHVEEGYLFVLGDNRNDSQDSRTFGTVDEKYVRGKMFYKLTKGSILERLLLLIYRDDSI